MYNKSIKLRPNEPLPTPDAKSNKSRRQSALAVGDDKKKSKRKSKKKRNRVHTLKAAPVLGRLPSSIPDPPPDEDEEEKLVIRTSGGADIHKLIHSSRPVSGARPISSAVEATETFRFSSESSGMRPKSVVQAGLAPPVPPPPPFSAIPTYNSPASFSGDRHSNASSKIVLTETFALSEGDFSAERETTESDEAPEGRRRGVSCVEAGLAPPPPPPPQVAEVEFEVTADAEVEVETEVEAEEPEYSSSSSSEDEETAVEIVPQRVRAETMSKAMKTALRREMRTGSMAQAPEAEKHTVAELLHQKDHSRFSILRYSTDLDGEQEFYDGTDEDEYYSDEEGADRFTSSPAANDPSSFINQFMYKVSEVEATEPSQVYRDVAKSVASAAGRDSRSRTISVVTSAPRALSVIQREEENIVKEQANEKKRRDSAKKLDEFLSSTRPKANTMDSDIPSSSSYTTNSSNRSSISKFVRNLASTPAIISSSAKANDTDADKDRPKMRERDLSDNQFYHVYAMTRQKFAQLSILKRAWLRQENKHRRPYAEDIEV